MKNYNLKFQFKIDSKIHLSNKIRSAVAILMVPLLSFSFISGTDFLAEQKKYERVRAAYKDKGTLVSENLKREKIDFNNCDILIEAFKSEMQLDVFAKNKSDKKYKKIESYSICASSGQLGPKRKSGDSQVPEGFYFIQRFNPSSNYYLSLGLSYPNQADLIKCGNTNRGGDIFIHGNCVTIGCLPMTDDKIKEIYIYALQAKQSGEQKIPVYIFPFRFTDKNCKKFNSDYKNNTELIAFWDNLKTGYDKFHNTFTELNTSVDKRGNYNF